MLPSWWKVKCGFVQQPTNASQCDLVPDTGRTTRVPPMPQPEGDQPANTIDKPVVPETPIKQDQGPEQEHTLL